MAFILKILSPVHIHSGEVVKSMNYTVRNKEVLIFDEIDVIQSIEQKEILNDELLRNFAASDNRRKEYNKTLNYYINRGIIHKSVIDKYKTKAINNVQDLSGQEIYRMMMNIRGPYIPGSTLKGAVRTAILYDYLLNKGIDYIKDAVDFLNYRGGRYLIDDYIIYGVDNNGQLNKVIQKDPFKFLGIKDINMVGNELEVYEEFIYNISGFVPGNIIETIKEGDYSEEFDFEIRVNEKLSNMYNEEILKYFNEEELLRVLHQYSTDIIDDELEYYKTNKHQSFNTKEIIERLEKIKSQNSINSPVLRIGKGKGYKSNTVALAIKKLDKNYYLKEIEKIANPPKYNKNYEYPKTRKFVNSIISPKLLGFTILEKADT